MSALTQDDLLEILHVIFGTHPVFVKDVNGKPLISSVVTSTVDTPARVYFGASTSAGFAAPLYNGSIGASESVDSREQWKAASDNNIIQTVNRWAIT